MPKKMKLLGLLIPVSLPMTIKLIEEKIMNQRKINWYKQNFEIIFFSFKFI